MKCQTELVKVVSVMEGESSKVHEMTSRETILRQKALRVDASIETQQRDLKVLRSGIRGMHTDMSKLNELLSKNKELQDTLANENFVTETDFVNELRELEARLKDAFMNKERTAQFAEKDAPMFDAK